MTEAARVEALRRAAAAKRAAATARAEAGLRKLVQQGSPVNFRAVAEAGGVSADFLYRHRELRGRIEHLRSRQEKALLTREQPEPGQGTATDSTVVSTLTARLRQARAEVAELKARLAVAHGELLALRRHVPASPR